MYETSKVSINGAVLTVKDLSERSIMHSHNIYSGGCLSPVVIRSGWHKPDFAKAKEIWNTFSPKAQIAVPTQYGIDFLHVRCRHCPKCTAAARWDWSRRAVTEHQAAKFSVFGTLTFSELWFARRWREENSEDVCSTFCDVPAFEERNRQTETKWLLAEFTNWLKRLRATGLTFRYMAVTEYGTKNGRPHIHFLMHLNEVRSYAKVRKALKANFEHFPGCNCGKGENCRVGWCDLEKVATEGACHYVCKYISKMWETVDEYGVISQQSARSRVRASLKYGHRDPGTLMPDDFHENPPSKKGSRDTVTYSEGADFSEGEAERARRSDPLTVTGLTNTVTRAGVGAKPYSISARWSGVHDSSEGRPPTGGEGVRTPDSS